MITSCIGTQSGVMVGASLSAVLRSRRRRGRRPCDFNLLVEFQKDFFFLFSVQIVNTLHFFHLLINKFEVFFMIGRCEIVVLLVNNLCEFVSTLLFDAFGFFVIFAAAATSNDSCYYRGNDESA